MVLSLNLFKASHLIFGSTANDIKVRLKTTNFSCPYLVPGPLKFSPKNSVTIFDIREYKLQPNL